MKVVVTQCPLAGVPTSYVAHLEPGVAYEFASADEAFAAHPLATLSRREGKPALDGTIRISLTFSEARRLREFLRTTVLTHSSLEDELLTAIGVLEI